jgi:hypothetical protein
MVPVASGTIPANSARITVLRDKQITARVNIVDNGKPIGTIAPGGQLVWDRIAGSMQLIAYHAEIPSDAGKVKPFNVCVGAGISYQFRVYFPAMQRYSSPNVELVSGTPVACEQSGTISTGKLEQVQPPSADVQGSNSFTGRIEKIDRLNPGFFNGMTPEGIWFKFSVVSDNGEEASFYEKKKTNIIDGEGKPFPNGWRPKKGKKVKVTYSVMPDGIFAGSNEALTIQHLE